jgi:hypothetical protein
LKTKNKGENPLKAGKTLETQRFAKAIVLADRAINKNAICSAFP